MNDLGKNITFNIKPPDHFYLSFYRKNLTQLSHDVIRSPPHFQIDDIKCFTTIDGGFGVAYSVSLDAQSVATNTSFPTPITAQVFMTSMRLGERNFSTSAIIYETTYPRAKISIRSCQQNHVNQPGYACFIRVRAAANATARTSSLDFWQMISFYSTGTLISTLGLASNLVNVTSGVILIRYTSATSLYYGGFLMTGTNQVGYLQGSVYDKDGSFVQDWGIDSLNGTRFDIMDNNTIWAAVPSQNNLGGSWELYFSDIPPLVDNVLPCTFNQQGQTYLVIVDGNFVKLDEFDEPLLGVKNGTWIFKTESGNDNPFTDDIDVIIRLSADTSAFFVAQNVDDERKFLNEMLTSFSEAIPVNASRLSISNRFQFDGDSQSSQILLKMTIKSTQDPSQVNSMQIYQDMSVLVTNKSITSLMFYNSTASLDSDYGVVILRGFRMCTMHVFDFQANLWQEYRYQFAGVICAFFVCLVIAFLAHNRYPQGKSMSLFKFILVMTDFALDIVFLFGRVQDVPSLYTPYSKAARFKIFRAPFTPTAERWIYLGSLVSLMLEDIPQLVVLSIYLHEVLVYRFSPLLTILTCSLIILANLIGRTYDCLICMQLRQDAVEETSIQEEGDNGSSSDSGRRKRRHPHFLSGFVPVLPRSKAMERRSSSGVIQGQTLLSPLSSDSGVGSARIS
ncbi:11662_t:CDS:2 [Acaulospora colombiana]|uniref:11662_t:CDS:1 n=1 Tax=Acaulospora colombiana TaxID=27376 RepID=A0ACA9L337_9GLOM|nr:11662_t:CDS:2 [Acaulospora colombiana]